MEIIIFKKYTNIYIKEYTDNSNIQCLGTFLCEMFIKDIERLMPELKKRNIVFSSTLSSSMYLYDETIEICRDSDRDLLDRQLDELPDFNTVSRFVINVDRFIEILEKWKEILIKKPTFIILKISDTEIIFEEDYREEIALDRSKLTIKEESIENIFNLKTKNGLFNGGFHLISENNKDLKLSNKINDISEVISVDIENEKDLTFNHAVFPEIYNKEDILNEISKKSGRPLYAIKYNKNKNEKLFDFWAAIRNDNEKNAMILRVISNQKNEIIACYPIFWEMI